jgi:hypothetical protein
MSGGGSAVDIYLRFVDGLSTRLSTLVDDQAATLVRVSA